MAKYCAPEIAHDLKARPAQYTHRRGEKRHPDDSAVAPVVVAADQECHDADYVQD